MKIQIGLKSFGLFAVLASLLFAGCRDESGDQPSSPGEVSNATSKAETPEEAIRVISEILRSGDFDTLVKTRYAEIGKAENEEQVEQLVRKFEEEFSDPQRVKETIADFMKAIEGSPTFSADGTMATFEADFGQLKLSRMDSGLWGFHL